MFYDIYLNYCTKAWIHAGEKGCGYYSYIKVKEIVIDPEMFTNPTEWGIFAMLHEIGHVMTNTIQMKRYEQEYLATVWAINEAKKIGFNVPKSYISIYQDYIWKWRETSIKRKAKFVVSKDSLTLIK